MVEFVKLSSWIKSCRKNEEDEYDAILKSLLQASDEKPGDKSITEGRNASNPEDASKAKENLGGLKTNDSISDKTVMRELLSSVKEKIGSEPLSPVNDSEHLDTVASSYRYCWDSRDYLTTAVSKFFF